MEEKCLETLPEYRERPVPGPKNQVSDMLNYPMAVRNIDLLLTVVNGRQMTRIRDVQKGQYHPNLKRQTG